MKPQELVADLLSLGPGQDLNQLLLYNRLLLRYLADHARDAQLADGHYLTDISDFVAWLHELVDAVRIPENAKVSWMTVKGTSPALTRRAPAAQSRWEDTCPRCGHIHQGSAECGEQLGGGRICRCEFEAVPA